MADRRGGTDGTALVIYADGAILPEQAGAGAVALDSSGRVVQLASRTLPAMTSGEAEYAGLMLALEVAAAHSAQQVEIRLDSAVVVYQMIGRFAVNSPRLKRCHQQACELARRLVQVQYRHVPRGENRLADALAIEAAAGRLWQMRE